MKNRMNKLAKLAAAVALLLSTALLFAAPAIGTEAPVVSPGADEAATGEATPDGDGSGLAEWDEESRGKLPDGMIYAPDPNITAAEGSPSASDQDDVLWETIDVSDWGEEQFKEWFGELPDGMTVAPDVDIKIMKNQAPPATEKGVGGDYAPVSQGNLPTTVGATFQSYVYTDKYFTGIASLNFNFVATISDPGGSATLTVYLVQRPSTSGTGTIVAERSEALPYGSSIPFSFYSLYTNYQYYLYVTLTYKSSSSLTASVYGTLT